MSSNGLYNCEALAQIMFNTGENCEAIPSRSFIARLSNTNGFHIPNRVTRPRTVCNYAVLVPELECIPGYCVDGCHRKQCRFKVLFCFLAEIHHKRTRPKLFTELPSFRLYITLKMTAQFKFHVYSLLPRKDSTSFIFPPIKRGTKCNLQFFFKSIKLISIKSFALTYY